MRPVLQGDLDQAVRVLLARSRTDWSDAMQELLKKADVADRYRKRTGKCHPAHGNGSLMSAAHYFSRGRLPTSVDRTYAEALMAVLRGLDCYRRG